MLNFTTAKVLIGEYKPSRDKAPAEPLFVPHSTKKIAAIKGILYLDFKPYPEAEELIVACVDLVAEPIRICRRRIS